MFKWLTNLFSKKKEVLYAYGCVGVDASTLSREEQEQEALRLREESRRHMEELGYHFDYEAAARRREEEAKTAPVIEIAVSERESYVVEEPVASLAYQAEVIQLSEYRRPALTQDSQEVGQIAKEDTGIRMRYPKNPHVPAQNTTDYRRKPRRQKEKEEHVRANMNEPRHPYVPSAIVSPVYGIQYQYPKHPMSAPPSYELDDDYPPNPEELYHNHLEEAYDRRKKTEIRVRPVTTSEYKANVHAYDQIRSKLYNIV